MNKRVVSLLLAITLVFLLLPTPATSAAPTAEDLEQQIRTLFQKAASTTENGSFHGYCGTLVSWQTYLLGIDTLRESRHGKLQFDRYQNMTHTSGGFRVRNYPASTYSLKDALMAITQNGTLDAYNIMVGFERTSTEAGQQYGHALFIHGILNGQVYFVECYNATVGGKYYAEGTPIVCTIDEFCTYYNRWTVLDGVCYFGLKTYADQCTVYPSTIDGFTQQQTPVTDEPWDAGIYEGATTLYTLASGAAIRATELLKTPGGRYFYRIETAGGSGYIPAESLCAMSAYADNVTLDGLKVPTSLRKGHGYTIQGTVTAKSAILRTVTVLVYHHDKGPETPELSVTAQVDSKSFSLRSAQIDKALTFRLLSPDTYHLSIQATFAHYQLVSGEIQEQTQSLELWNSDFRIITDQNKYHNISFDANGGEGTLLSATLAQGEAIGRLPTAVRPGYRFVGWFTQPEGGEPITEATIVSGPMSLYAQWIQDSSAWEGWVQTGDLWNYYRDGELCAGWIYYFGLRFYRNPDGTAPSGWHQIGNDWYYFNSFGVAYTGWYQENGKLYYLLENGKRATGWTTAHGTVYYFHADGTMHTGWLTEDETRYYFSPAGNMLTGEVTIDGTRYYFREDGTMCTGWIRIGQDIKYLNSDGLAVTGWFTTGTVTGFFDDSGVLKMTSSLSGNGLWHPVLSAGMRPMALIQNLYILP